jgi:hypothetical protein
MDIVVFARFVNHLFGRFSQNQPEISYLYNIITHEIQVIKGWHFLGFDKQELRLDMLMPATN